MGGVVRLGWWVEPLAELWVSLGKWAGSWAGPGGPSVTCSHSEEEEDLAQAQSWADT